MATIFRFDVVDVGSRHVVRLHGELDMLNANELRDFLVRIAGSTVVVDLSDLRFIDSSGITALMSARKEILAIGQGFEVRCATGIVRRVFEITGLGFLLSH